MKVGSRPRKGVSPSYGRETSLGHYPRVPLRFTLGATCAPSLRDEIPAGYSNFENRGIIERGWGDPRHSRPGGQRYKALSAWHLISDKKRPPFSAGAKLPWFSRVARAWLAA